MKKRLLPIFTLLLFTAFAHGQFTDSSAYDFRDGSIVTNGQNTDGSLTLNGTYALDGAQYGIDMKENSEINIAVTSSRTFRFLGSIYSSLSMVGSAKTVGDLGTQATKVATDLGETYDFVYWGSEDIVNFTAVGPGTDAYIPYIEVIPAQAGGNVSLTAPVKNIIYYFDLRDGSIIPAETDLVGNYTIEQGLFQIESGSSNAYGYNGNEYGSILKPGNIITLKVAGNSYIKVGGCTYSGGTIDVSSESGAFDVTSQSSTTATEFGVDSASVDFLYVGTEGTVELTFSGTTYIPYIEIVPVPYEVELAPWVVKSGAITLNGIDISLTSGASSSENATVTVSEGTVISATNEIASIYINLDGKDLSTLTPTLSGDIESVSVHNDSLIVTYSDANTLPNSYIIKVTDNSTVIEAEAGKTYSYDLTDGSEMPQVASTKYSTFLTSDGIVEMNSNEGAEFWFHDTSHGAVFYTNNSMSIHVAGNATITFITCTYSVDDAIFVFRNENGDSLGFCVAENYGGDDGVAYSFTYNGNAGIVTATLVSTGAVYLHGLSIENAAAIIPSNGKIDVWDMGAAQLDTGIYNNQLNDSIINSWYEESITTGSSGNVLPGFSAGVLSWIGGGNDRLRTTNTKLTRYDENIASAVGYTGRIYVNSSAATGRYLSLTLSEDDELSIITRTDATGNINFQYVADPVSQTDEVTVGALDSLHFVAKEAGTYHIFDNQGKPSYFRIYRKDADYSDLSGAVDVTQADGIPGDYALLFTNEAGKTWSATASGGNYSLKLPVGYTYQLSLANANGYIINNGKTLEITDATTSYDISIEKVELYVVSGAITGLDTEIANLELVYTADPTANKIYLPEPLIDTDAKTYTVQLEPGCEYTISANGVNDYYIPSSTLTIGTADQTTDVAFSAKPVYDVTIYTRGLTKKQLSEMSITFSNLYEEGYVYNFANVGSIQLRDGTYTITYDSLDDYPVELGLTSNLIIDGAEGAKNLQFYPVKEWPFNDKVITTATSSYKGLLFLGNIYNAISSGHLALKDSASIKIPVSEGEKVIVTYYYTAEFSIDGGDTIRTNSKSTSVFEYAEYIYTGDGDGFVTINNSKTITTYLTNIKIEKALDYEPIIYVGTDKEFKTINEALDAIAMMDRTSNERVTVMIDPGNYEEMLVISSANVTLKNASDKPSIALLNKGVDIDPNAVRVTSYYGYGYSYYSMKNNQKWDAEVLRVNKENGYLSYTNKSGTTNGSYWNSTVVISANDFIAEDIIFENSFNQYISKKESEDVIVMWESGNKGLRPTDYGNTAVQNRSFVERAAAIGLIGDRAILNRCRVVSRQDSYYGGTNSRVAIYKGAMMGGVDYLFGAMVATFYKTDLVMNVSDESVDVSYLTAAQQSSGRGYLMYECTVKSAVPGTESASTYKAKPGYFGRPWQATTSEVVFYNTTVETSNFPGSEGKSLINPAGWSSSLGGESSMMYEYGTSEESGVDNSSGRVSWSTVLSSPTLSDGTEINTFNFTKGTDDWDPIPTLIDNDTIIDDTGNDAIISYKPESSVNVYSNANRIYITNVSSYTQVNIYNINGSLVKSLNTYSDTNFDFAPGFWIVQINATEGQKAVKLITQ